MAVFEVDAPDTLAESSIFAWDAPDSLWEGLAQAFDAPDSLEEASVFAVDRPDRIIIAPLLVVDCPDSVSVVAIKAFDCPDRLVTGSIPVSLNNSLNLNPTGVVLWRHDVLPSNGTTILPVLSPPISSLTRVQVTDHITGAIITDGGATISGDGLSVILTSTFPGDTITLDYNTATYGAVTPQGSATPKAWAQLMLNGSPVVYNSLRVTHKIKGGWDWSATLPHSTLDLYTTADWRITINDGLGYQFTTPRLVALPRDKTDVRSETSPAASVSGVDYTTHRMSVRNKSFDTFKNSNSNQVLQALATSEGLRISGAETFPVIDEDAKQIMLASAIGRVIFTSAQEWEVDTDGAIRLTKWSELAGPLEVDWSTIKHKVDPEKRFTSLKIGKRSAHHGGGTVQGSQDYPFTDVGPKIVQLSTPLYNPEAYNRSTLGFVDLVAFYDGDPTKPGSNCIKIQAWNQGLGLNLPQAFASGKPSTHFSCFCFNPGGTVQIVSPGLTPDRVVCLLRVTGTPPAVQAQIVDTEPEFLVQYDSGITPAWPAPDWVDNLPPTKAWATSHAPDYLSILSDGWDTISMDAVCHASVKLRQWFSYNSILYKAKEISWSCGSSGVPTTDIELTRV